MPKQRSYGEPVGKTTDHARSRTRPQQTERQTAIADMTGRRQRRACGKHSHANEQATGHEPGRKTCGAGFGDGMGRVRMHLRTDSIIPTGCRVQSKVALGSRA